MAQERLSMRKIREILRLRFAGLSPRQIAASIGSALSTIHEKENKSVPFFPLG